MRNILRDYLHNVDVHYLFYCYDENIKSDYSINGDILRINGTDSYIPGIFKKTIKRLNFVLDLLLITWSEPMYQELWTYIYFISIWKNIVLNMEDALF